MSWDKFRKDGIPARYVVAAVAFFNFIYLYLLRLNVNIAIVAMVNYTAIPHTNITLAEECQLEETEEAAQQHVSSPDGEFVWDEQIQSLVSGSFFWGYSVTQLFGGRLAERIGTKYIFTAAQITAAAVTLCLPTLARVGVEFMIMGRVLLGLAQGVCIPSIQPLVAKWAPAQERSSISTFIHAGAQMGTIVGIPFSGFIADSLGWEAVFYIEGSLVVLFVGTWLGLVYDSPGRHPRISKEERQYIEENTASANSQKKLPVPWKSILTSVPCWALLIATLGNNWAFYMLLTELPIYMKNILRFNTKSNALLSALPYLCMWIFSMVVAQIADLAARRKWASINVIRKTSNTIAHCGPAICLIIVAFIGCETTWTLVLLTVGVGFEGAIYSGFIINQLDLAPNFAGTIYGLISGISSVNSWLAPLTVATLTEGQQTLARWRIAFLMTAAILFFDNAVFAVFGSTEEQPWNRPAAPPRDAEAKSLAVDEDMRPPNLRKHFNK